jgi:hypothetical protein
MLNLIPQLTKKTIMKMIITLFLGLILIGSTQNAQAQSETCTIIAEISLTAVERGAFLVCTRSANPAACTIALAADACGSDPACSGFVSHFVEKGCNYTIEVVGDNLKIIGKATKENIEELSKTYDAINSVEGIIWLQNILSGY